MPARERGIDTVRPNTRVPLLRFCRATFNVEHGFTDVFASVWGFPFAGTGWQGGMALDWVHDVVTLFRALRIVVNNSPSAIGGGGAPLQPAPPPFC